MPAWKFVLLHLYYYGSYPYRRWRNSRAAGEGRMPVVVLFYHRVADDGANPWTVSNRRFARQIGWLADRFEMISLAEAQRRIRGGNRRPCVSITFDDGYAENCREAIPLLLRESIPCTYFVTLGNVFSGEPFAHDLARGDRLPPNDLGQLREMAAAGIEIGAHTYSHADLGQVTDEQRLYREVVTAGEDLQERLGHRVRYFAFPIGQRANLSGRAFDLARAAGYEAACSAYGGYNLPGQDPFHLQRIGVDDEMIGLKNRASIDPRKLGIARFVVEPAEVPTEVPVAGPVPELTGTT